MPNIDLFGILNHMRYFDGLTMQILSCKTTYGIAKSTVKTAVGLAEAVYNTPDKI